MILSTESRFFSTGATLGAFLASSLCFLFPSISIYIMLVYAFLAGVSLYKLKDEFNKFL